MKLHVAFDFTQINDALEVARLIAPHADILEVGSLLLYSAGIFAVRAFRKEFPDKMIMVDARLVDRVDESLALFASAGANTVSVLAGASNKTIQQASSFARKYQMNILLDLIDASSPEQSAFDAAQLDVTTLLFQRENQSKGAIELLEQWQNIRENTKLPIFIAGKIDRASITNILKLKPQGIVIGSSITLAKNPAEEAEFFKNQLIQSTL